MEIPIVDNQHSFVSDRVIKLLQKIIAQFTKKNAFDHTFFSTSCTVSVDVLENVARFSFDVTYRPILLPIVNICSIDVFNFKTFNPSHPVIVAICALSCLSFIQYFNVVK